MKERTEGEVHLIEGRTPCNRYEVLKPVRGQDPVRTKLPQCIDEKWSLSHAWRGFDRPAN
jgi:hypothetical protein